MRTNDRRSAVSGNVRPASHRHIRATPTALIGALAMGQQSDGSCGSRSIRCRRGQSMVTVVHGVAYTSVTSALSTHRIINVAPENGARSAALKAAEA